MTEMNFVDRVKKHFDFLETQYNFKIIYAKDSDLHPETDGLMKYESDTTLILIDSELGSVGVRFARVVDGEKYYLTPIDIYEYFNTSDKEKELLLSTNPKDYRAASILANEKSLLNQPDWKDVQGTIQNLEKELNNFANWLKTHDDLCLKGDFSQWLKFYEYKIHRARATHLRRGKDEFTYARVKGADGSYELVKQSLFKTNLEHIEKMKKEFLK